MVVAHTPRAGQFSKRKSAEAMLRDQISVVERGAATPAPPWNQTILCLPFGHIEPRDAKTHRTTCGTVWVVNEDDLISALEDWPERKNRLATPARTRWTGAVGRLAISAKNDDCHLGTRRNDG